jgi:hypothetical protein
MNGTCVCQGSERNELTGRDTSRRPVGMTNVDKPAGGVVGRAKTKQPDHTSPGV